MFSIIVVTDHHGKLALIKPKTYMTHIDRRVYDALDIPAYLIGQATNNNRSVVMATVSQAEITMPA
jgi:hypothetical protein